MFKQCVFFNFCQPEAQSAVTEIRLPAPHIMPGMSAGDSRGLSMGGRTSMTSTSRTSIGSFGGGRSSMATSTSSQSLTGPQATSFAIAGTEQVHDLAAQLANARAAVVEAEEAARREREAADKERQRAEKAVGEAGAMRVTLELEQGVWAARQQSTEGGDFLSAQVQDAYTELSAENVMMSEEAAKLQERLESARTQQHKLRAASAHRRAELMLQRKASATAGKRADQQLELAVSSLSTERTRASLLEAEKQRLAQAERDAGYRAELLAEENTKLARRADEHAAAAQKAVDEARALKEQLKRTNSRAQSSKRREAATRDEVHRLSLQLQSERQGVVREKADERRFAALAALTRRREVASAQVRARGEEIREQTSQPPPPQPSQPPPPPPSQPPPPAPTTKAASARGHRSANDFGASTARDTARPPSTARAALGTRRGAATARGVRSSRSEGALYTRQTTESARMRQIAKEAAKAEAAAAAAAAARKAYDAEWSGAPPASSRHPVTFGVHGRRMAGGASAAAVATQPPGGAAQRRSGPMVTLALALREHPELEEEILAVANRVDLTEAARMVAIQRLIHEREMMEARVAAAPPSTQPPPKAVRTGSAASRSREPAAAVRVNMRASHAPSVTPSIPSTVAPYAPLSATGSKPTLSPRPQGHHSLHQPVRAPDRPPPVAPAANGCGAALHGTSNQICQPPLSHVGSSMVHQPTVAPSLVAAHAAAAPCNHEGLAYPTAQGWHAAPPTPPATKPLSPRPLSPKQLRDVVAASRFPPPPQPHEESAGAAPPPRSPAKLSSPRPPSPKQLREIVAASRAADIAQLQLKSPMAVAAAAPQSPSARLSLRAALEGDGALQHSMSRIRALMREADVTLPTDLFEDVVGYVGATPKPLQRRDGRDGS